MAKQAATTNTNTAVEKLNQDIKPQKSSSIEELIIQSAKQLGMALPEHMRPERIVRIALTTLRTNPKLYECDAKSILAALFQSAQLGLEPNLNGEAWIIPYNVSVKLPNGQWSKRMMAQFQIGVYGLVKLFWNHMNSIALTIESVHKNDLFEYDLGSQTLKHIPPAFGNDRGEVMGYYAAAVLVNGGRSIKVMSREEVEEHAKRFSKCFVRKDGVFMDGTPWKEHFNSMGKVTVLKQLLKVLPKSVEIQKALSMDSTIKTAIEPDMSNAPTAATYEEILAPDEDAGDIKSKSNGNGEAKNDKAQTNQPVKPPPTQEPIEAQHISVDAATEQQIPQTLQYDILESQLGDLEIKGNATQLRGWFVSNSKVFPKLSGQQRTAILKRYQKALKEKGL
jgi:recombination protein RecT